MPELRTRWKVPTANRKAVPAPQSRLSTVVYVLSSVTSVQYSAHASTNIVL